MKKNLNCKCSQKRTLVLFGFFLLFFTSAIFSQDKAIYSIKFKLQIKDGDMKNSLITITKNGAPFKTIDPSGGKYNIDLFFNAEYLFTCTKMGYITKSLIIDTHVPNGREGGDFAKNYPSVELEKQPEAQEITYTQPVGRIKFDGITDDFDFDKDYSQKALEMEKKATANPKPKPKEPAPNPRPVPPKPIAQTAPASNPIPVVVKQPEYKQEPPKPKPIIVEPVVEQKPIVKSKDVKVIQKDRLKITIIMVLINDVNFEYKMEEYTWGGVFYYRNGKIISESSFFNETK